MQGFVDEGAIHHEASVVEAGAELGGHDVEIVFVADGDRALVEGKEVFVGSSAVGIGAREVEFVAVFPLEWPW